MDVFSPPTLPRTHACSKTADGDTTTMTDTGWHDESNQRARSAGQQKRKALQKWGKAVKMKRRSWAVGPLLSFTFSHRTAAPLSKKVRRDQLQEWGRDKNRPKGMSQIEGNTEEKEREGGGGGVMREGRLRGTWGGLWERRPLWGTSVHYANSGASGEGEGGRLWIKGGKAEPETFSEGQGAWEDWGTSRRAGGKKKINRSAADLSGDVKKE